MTRLPFMLEDLRKELNRLNPTMMEPAVLTLDDRTFEATARAWCEHCGTPYPEGGINGAIVIGGLTISRKAQ